MPAANSKPPDAYQPSAADADKSDRDEKQVLLRIAMPTYAAAVALASARGTNFTGLVRRVLEDAIGLYSAVHTHQSWGLTAECDRIIKEALPDTVSESIAPYLAIVRYPGERTGFLYFGHLDDGMTRGGVVTLVSRSRNGRMNISENFSVARDSLVGLVGPHDGKDFTQREIFASFLRAGYQAVTPQLPVGITLPQ